LAFTAGRANTEEPFHRPRAHGFRAPQDIPTARQLAGDLPGCAVPPRRRERGGLNMPGSNLIHRESASCYEIPASRLASQMIKVSKPNKFCTSATARVVSPLRQCLKLVPARLGAHADSYRCAPPRQAGPDRLGCPGSIILGASNPNFRSESSVGERLRFWAVSRPANPLPFLCPTPLAWTQLKLFAGGKRGPASCFRLCHRTETQQIQGVTSIALTLVAGTGLKAHAHSVKLDTTARIHRSS